jgi:DNA-binding FadR family transcriptional regulator
MVVQFGVSRSVIREALRSLEQMGLVTVRQGASGGTFVGDLSLGKMAEVFTVMMNLDRFKTSHVYEVALLLETTVAELAAQNGTPQDLELLEENLLDHYHAEFPEEERATLGFHVALARASGNPLMETLVTVLINLVRRNPQLYPSGLDFPHESNQDHVAILEAVKRKDGGEARRLMREHLLKIEKAVMGLETAEPAQLSTPSA